MRTRGGTSTISPEPFGDTASAVLAAVGYEFRRILQWIKLWLAIIWAVLALSTVSNSMPVIDESLFFMDSQLIRTSCPIEAWDQILLELFSHATACLLRKLFCDKERLLCGHLHAEQARSFSYNILSRCFKASVHSWSSNPAAVIGADQAHRVRATSIRSCMLP